MKIMTVTVELLSDNSHNWLKAIESQVTIATDSTFRLISLSSSLSSRFVVANALSSSVITYQH